MDELDAYSALWSSQKEQYLLVPVRLADGRSFYDIYHRDGTYSTLFDEDLNSRVAERMLAAGVPVMEPDAWVLSQKMREHEHLWTSDPSPFIVVRCVGGEKPPVDVIYRQDGSSYSIYEDGVRNEVIQQMVAAGVELVEVEVEEQRADEYFESAKSGNQQVVEEHDSSELDAACVFRLLAQPSFQPWVSWRLVRHCDYGTPPTYVTRFLTWKYESPLPFRERVRLPWMDQGWKLELIRDEIRWDSDDAEETLQKLSGIRVPAFVDELCGGRDGTTYRLTVGARPHESAWVWWNDGPQEWAPLVKFAMDACVGSRYW